MSRQAKKPAFNGPTVQSIVTQIVGLHRLYLVAATSQTSEDRIQAKYAIKKMEEVLGVRFAEKSEERDFPELSQSFRRDSVLVEIPSEQYAIFTPSSVSSDMGVLKKRGNDYISSLMTKGFGRKIKHGCNFPDHVRRYMKADGLEPKGIEVLIALLGAIEFTQNQTVYKLESQFTDNHKKTRCKQGSRDRHSKSYRTDLENKIVTTIQINLPGTPKVRMIQKGISLGVKLPDTMIYSLAGQKLEKLISIKGLEKAVIRKAQPYAEHILHVHLEGEYS